MKIPIILTTGITWIQKAIKTMMIVNVAVMEMLHAPLRDVVLPQSLIAQVFISTISHRY